MSYAQQNEDLFVEQLFSVGFCGRLLELGAGHPTHLSMSRYLLEKGWSGVLVEASPRTFAGLIDAYPANPKVEIVNAAVVGSRRGLVKFSHRTKIVYSDYPASHWSTMHPEVLPDGEWETFWVSAIFVEDLKTAFPDPFDYVSIDLEGETIGVVEPVIDAWRPKLICIEHEGRYAELREIAERRNYDVVFQQHVNMMLHRRE